MTVKEALASLPPTSEGVVEYLRQAGIKGDMNNPLGGCLIASCLRWKTGSNHQCVGFSSASDLKGGYVQIPHHISTVIDNWSLRRYPDLLVQPPGPSLAPEPATEAIPA